MVMVPVLDEPVVIAALGTVANNQNTVVELAGAALRLSVDTCKYVTKLFQYELLAGENSTY